MEAMTAKKSAITFRREQGDRGFLRGHGFHVCNILLGADADSLPVLCFIQFLQRIVEGYHIRQVVVLADIEIWCCFF